MNLSNVPFFILFFAIIYLSIIYGLLKIAETQMHNISSNVSTVSRPSADSKQRMKIP
jgi:hypothetical protein